VDFRWRYLAKFGKFFCPQTVMQTVTSTSVSDLSVVFGVLTVFPGDGLHCSPCTDTASVREELLLKCWSCRNRVGGDVAGGTMAPTRSGSMSRKQDPFLWGSVTWGCTRVLVEAVGNGDEKVEKAGQKQVHPQEMHSPRSGLCSSPLQNASA
jgi:hypothetical protein